MRCGCDVTDAASVDQMVQNVVRQTGQIDLLVNNAGSALIGGAEESSIEQAQALFNVNVFGVMRATNAVLPYMRAQQSGRIINISSVLGFIPSPFAATYSATKHAVEGHSESLDHEMRSFGIRVVLVEPYFTHTPSDLNAIGPDRSLRAYAASRERASDNRKAYIAAGDAPELVAETVLAAAISPAPQLRYATSKNTRRVRLLRRFVPARIFDSSLRKQLGLPA
ncbi:oxidoreductase (plasmid) [Devosia neptuniae]|uniref:Oxidoreductase n=1 Tax=Devosia neptuniae TaxID=191302 RepID=A0ABY6CAS3_9HYPH|nr:oxidoreductase [Devosia neptuniae]